jgi:hypothetical protein
VDDYLSHLYGIIACINSGDLVLRHEPSVSHFLASGTGGTDKLIQCLAGDQHYLLIFSTIHRGYHFQAYTAI